MSNMLYAVIDGSRYDKQYFEVDSVWPNYDTAEKRKKEIEEYLADEMRVHEIYLKTIKKIC